MGIKRKAHLSDTQIDEIAATFAILSEPSRLKLLRALMERSMTVTELMKHTEMRQGNVSKHLGVLLTGGFVARVREGAYVRYTLSDPGIRDLCTLMCARVAEQARDRLRALTS